MLFVIWFISKDIKTGVKKKHSLDYFILYFWDCSLQVPLAFISNDGILLVFCTM